MLPSKTSYSAKYISYKILNGNINYRRLYFKNVRNVEGDIIKEDFFIDESEELKAIGYLSHGVIVSFMADEDWENIEFCYPHSKF